MLPDFHGKENLIMYNINNNLRNHFAQIIYWTLYTKIGIYNLERKDRWHDHEPKTVLKNDEAKIL